MPAGMGSLLVAALNPPPVAGEYRFVQQQVLLLDDEGRPVVDEFGEPEMVVEVSPPCTMTITLLPRFTGVLAYLAEEQR